MNKHQLKAFTILEVTITMLVAGVLIGITYTSYSIIVKSYHAFTKKNDNMAVVVTLDHLLKRDFERADIILKDSDGVAMRSGSTIIQYAFTPDFIVRTSAKTDTFKVQAQALKTVFENLPIVEIQPIAEQNRIDEIDFILIFQDEKIPCHYKKFYSSENLIQRNPNALN
jgi:Tfp pilus assembly protein PilE